MRVGPWYRLEFPDGLGNNRIDSLHVGPDVIERKVSLQRDLAAWGGLDEL